VEVLQVGICIVAIPLFKIDIPSSSKCIRFGAEFSVVETNYKVETGEIFGPMCFSTHKDFGC